MLLRPEFRWRRRLVDIKMNLTVSGSPGDHNFDRMISKKLNLVWRAGCPVGVIR